RRISISVGLALTSVLVMLSFMGLPKFAVTPSADVETLWEITKPPEYNHVGYIRVVPYDQLEPGMYTTMQLDAAPEDELASVNGFNQLIQGDNEATAFQDFMKKQPNYLPLGSVNFTPIPADAPELRSVMERFKEFLDENANELYHGWGAIV